MSELIIPVGILALVTTAVAVAAWVSDYVGKAGACKVMDAERSGKSRPR